MHVVTPNAFLKYLGFKNSFKIKHFACLILRHYRCYVEIRNISFVLPQLFCGFLINSIIRMS